MGVTLMVVTLMVLTLMVVTLMGVTHSESDASVFFASFVNRDLGLSSNGLWRGRVTSLGLGFEEVY